MRVKYSDISQTFFQFSFHVTVVFFFFIIVEKILNTRVLLSYTCQGNCRSPPPVCVLFLAEFARWLPSVQWGLRRWGWKTQMLLQLQGHLSPQWNSSYFWILPKVSPRFPPGVGERNRIRKEQTRVTESRSGTRRPPRCSRGGSRGEWGGGVGSGSGVRRVFGAVKLFSTWKILRSVFAARLHSLTL